MDFEDAPILFSLLFTAVSTRHLRHRNFRYRHLHFRSGSFPYSIRLPVPFRPPACFVQLAGLTDIAKGALLFHYRHQSSFPPLTGRVIFGIQNAAGRCLRHFFEVLTGFEPVHNGFADRCLTTWLRHHINSAAIKAANLIWSGLRGSNSLPPPWQGGALTR